MSNHLPDRDRVQLWLDEPGLTQYGHGAVGSLMKAYVANELRTTSEWRDTGIECELARSRPLVEGGPYEIIVISDVPANSLTMHGKLMLVPIDE